MEPEPKKAIVLRAVNREASAPPKGLQETGIAFERVEQTRCTHCGSDVPLADARPLSCIFCPTCGGKVFVPGRVGGFLLYERIGEGEMGAIYRATDESLNREVAVKLVRGCHADAPESRERLRGEARAAGRLNHPRVAQVYALNFSNGCPYLVMELVHGQDFAQKLEVEGQIDERTALKMALDVADGLSALNREGLVHGDIKPGNIVLDRDGNAKLVDFGLSGMTRNDGTGAFVGTPNYIAPELLRRAPDTHRSDLYSLGATLYHLLAGRPPFDGETPTDVIKAKLREQPVPLGKCAKHVSQLTRKLVMQMLEFDPAKRQASSEVVAAEIRKALASLDSPPAGPSERALLFRRLLSRIRLPSWPRRPAAAPSHALRSFLIAGLLGLLAGGAFWLARSGQPLRVSLPGAERLDQLREELARRIEAFDQRSRASAASAAKPPAAVARPRRHVLDIPAGDLALKDGGTLGGAVLKGVSGGNVVIVKYAGGVGMYSLSQFAPASALAVSNLLRDVAASESAAAGTNSTAVPPAAAPR